MARIPPTLAVAVLLPFLAQATGAASLPAVMIAPPGAFMPPGARLGAIPKAAAAKTAPRAAGESWLDSARVVARFLYELTRETPPAARPSLPAPRAEAVPPTIPETAVEMPAPVVEAPARDRMLIAMAPGERLEGVIGRGDTDFSTPPSSALRVAAPMPTLPAFHERRFEQAGLSAQVSYLNPHGVVHGFSDGYVAVFADGMKRYVAEKLQPAFQREFPIYWHGEQIEVELTLVNRTGHPLRGVRVSAVQETFRPVGGEGMRLSPPAELTVPGVIPAGGQAVVHWFVLLEGPSHAAVNLEQTHVTVSAGANADAAPLLDAPQAGVIDPPGPGLL